VGEKCIQRFGGGNLNRRDVLVNLGVDGKIMNRMDGRGLDRIGIGTVLMCPRDRIDVPQGPYRCVPWTIDVSQRLY
jgi:hypothetical protein